MKPFACDQRVDPVERLVRDLSAEEMVEWMVKYHGLPKSNADTVISNLREQYRWHRLQGRLDHRPFLILLAELWGLRRGPSILETPKTHPTE